jgi:hypothetical protein
MKHKNILLLFVVLLLLSGCVKSTTTMKVNSTKSIVFSTDFLVSKEIENVTVLDKINQEKLVANHFNISTISEDNYEGVRITKRYNVDKVSNALGKEVVLTDLLKGTMDDSTLFKVKKSFFKNTYYADFSYRLRSEIFANGGDDVDLSSDKMITLDSEQSYRFILEVPYGTIQNNAKEVSDNGKKLTWFLNRSNDTNIKFTFTLLNLTHVYIVAGIGLVVLVFIGIIIFKVIKQKREEAKNAGPIHVDYDPSIEDKLSAFEIEEDIPPEVAETSDNNQIVDNSFEFKLPEEEKAKIAIVEAAKTLPPEKKQPKFIMGDPVDEVVDFSSKVDDQK